MVASLRMSVAGLTDVGRTREHNEDRYLVWNVAGREPIAAGATEVVPHEEGVLIAVCDGMGGAAAGEKASALAVETLQDRARGLDGADLQDLDSAGEWLSRAVVEADRRILEAAEADPGLKGMGSTCTAVIVLSDGLTLAHVGDSRAYHLREGTLRQISVDHSYVGQLVALGRISPEEARVHDQRNLLLQVLGLGRPLEVDRVRVEVDPGDRLLLCSDGLYDLVEDEELRRELLENTDPASACRNLVDVANQRGGRDNITVVVARVE